MPDAEFAQTVHAANDAGFIIDAHMRHACPDAKRMGLPGDLFEIVIRRGLEVFWIGASLSRPEVQRHAAAQLKLLQQEYSNDAGVKIN